MIEKPLKNTPSAFTEHDHPYNFMNALHFGNHAAYR
jgi:hypothetical protein